jgi:hypothetical protein
MNFAISEDKPPGRSVDGWGDANENHEYRREELTFDTEKHSGSTEIRERTA